MKADNALIDVPSWAVMKAERRAHVDRVAALLEEWSRELNVPAPERERWLLAAALHDALRDEDGDAMAGSAPPGWPPSLWHGPAAADRAAKEGIRDAGVLAAVRYHSVGYAGWDRVGRMLYLADYLEPGRSFKPEKRAALAARVCEDPDGSILAAVRHRLKWVVRHGLPLIEETVDFWNSLVEGR